MNSRLILSNYPATYEHLEKVVKESEVIMTSLRKHHLLSPNVTRGDKTVIIPQMLRL